MCFSGFKIIGEVPKMKMAKSGHDFPRTTIGVLEEDPNLGLVAPWTWFMEAKLWSASWTQGRIYYLGDYF